jgi:hypothetical protein
VVKHEFVDAGLGDAGLPAALADGDDLGGGAGEVEDGVRDEVVGQDDVGSLEQGVGAEGEEIGCAGACADEVDGSGLGFGRNPGLSIETRGTRVQWSSIWRGLVRACRRA